MLLTLENEKGEGLPGHSRATKIKLSNSSNRAVERQTEGRTDEIAKGKLELEASVSPVAHLADDPLDDRAPSTANVPTDIVGTVSEPLATSSAGVGPSGFVVALANGKGLATPQHDRSVTKRFVQVRYAYNPKPDYPEGARKEGKEGRVLLRVLVDEDGSTKSVEVSGSSGNKALDAAAAEAIKGWRFSPARYGDEPVASWVKIPIEFRLTETKE